MERGVVILLFGIMAMALYKGMIWLAGICIAVLGLMYYGQASKPRPAPAGGKEEEILTPVIVTDEGPPPYLYPPNFGVKVFPRWGDWGILDNMGFGLAGMVNTGYTLLTGKPIKGYRFEKERWGVGKVAKKKGLPIE